MMFDGASLFNETYDLVYNDEPAPALMRQPTLLRPPKIEALLNKTHGLTESEKTHLFTYLRDGE